MVTLRKTGNSSAPLLESPLAVAKGKDPAFDWIGGFVLLVGVVAAIAASVWQACGLDMPKVDDARL